MKYISWKSQTIFGWWVMLKMFADLSHTIVSEKSVSDNFGYWDTWKKQILTVWEYQDSWIKTRLNLISPNVFLNKFFRKRLISGARLHRRCQVFWDLTDGGIFELRDLIGISVYGGFSLPTISISFIFSHFWSTSCNYQYTGKGNKMWTSY